MSALLLELFWAFLVILLLSFAVGLLSGGGPIRGRQIVAWELKWLTKIGRLILKHLLKFVADVCTWAHKKL